MKSIMAQEIRAIPSLIRGQLRQDEDLYTGLADRLRAFDPQFLVTVARGSSDSVAGYLAQLMGRKLGLLVASIPPSLVTHGERMPSGRGTCVFAISQSGQSPDLIAPVQTLGGGGALTVAIVNDAHSPLAQAAEWVLPARAGAERSVAATKSYMACAVAGARLVAHLAGDKDLRDALGELPDRLERALDVDWRAAEQTFVAASNAFVIGRGPAWPVAQEVALKFKETCILHAEAFSAAEVRHGPVALVGEGFPMLFLGCEGPFQSQLLEMRREMEGMGAQAFVAVPGRGDAWALPLPAPLHPDLDPLVALQACYIFLAGVAEARGLDPDHPRNLSKVTLTF